MSGGMAGGMAGWVEDRRLGELCGDPERRGNREMAERRGKMGRGGSGPEHE